MAIDWIRAVRVQEDTTSLTGDIPDGCEAYTVNDDYRLRDKAVLTVLIPDFDPADFAE